MIHIPTIAIANHKGGVGKTTTAVNLAAALALNHKQKVLLIDMDPQGNATTFVGVTPQQVPGTLLDVFSKEKTLKDVIIPTSINGLSLIGGRGDLTKLDDLVRQNKESMHFLDQALSTELLSLTPNGYSSVVIDCPPAMGMLAVSALVAARRLIIPLLPDFLSVAGLSQMLETYRLIKRINPALVIGGLLITNCDLRTTLAKEVIQALRSQYGKLVFQTVIPRNVRLAEAPAHGKSVMEYDPQSSGAYAYEQLAQEVHDRVTEK